MIYDMFIRRPRLAMVISIIIVVLGAISIYSIPVSQYPTIAPPTVQVNAVYIGADALTMEESVAQLIEGAVNGVDGMRYMKSSSSSDGTYSLTVYFDLTTNPDINAVNVQNRVSTVESKLPQEVRDQGVNVTKKAGDLLQAMSFYSPNQTHDGLFISNYVTINIVDELKRISGVGDASVFGAQDYSMRIWIDPPKLRALNLTADDVIAAVQSQNKQAAVGRIGAAPVAADQQLQLTVTAKGRLNTVEEFQNILLRANPDGSVVRLRNVARVELSTASFDVMAEFNQQPTAMVGIYLSPGANAVAVSEAVNQRVAELSERFPEDLTYESVFDNSLFVNEMIKKVITTLLEAFVLVTIVVFVFLGRLRATLIPLIAVPVSIIGAVAVAYMLGFTANTISLLALVLAIGIVVDDAIIVVENVERVMHEEPDLTPAQATSKAVGEIAGPVLAITFVLLSVFVPVAFLPGSSGVLFREFAVTISAAMVLSAVNALTLAPALCAILMRSGNLTGVMAKVSGGIDGLGHGYANIIKKSAKMAAVSIPAVIAFGLISFWIVGNTPDGFVPDEDKGYAMVLVNLPPGASLNRTDKVMREAEVIIKNDPSVESTTMVMGLDLLSGGGSSPNAGVIFVKLKDYEDRTSADLTSFAFVYRTYGALAGIPEATFFPVNPAAIDGLGTVGGFEFIMESLEGQDPTVMAQVARSLTVAANGSPDLAAFFTSFNANTPQLDIKLDRDRAQVLGLNIASVYNALQATLGGYYINDFNLYGRTWSVRLQAEEEYRSGPEDINSIFVRSDTGEMVELSSVVTTELSRGANTITRYNNYRAVAFNGNAAPGVGLGQSLAAMDEVAVKALPKGYAYEWTGLALEQKEAAGQTAIVLGLAFLFAYLFLVALYESWNTPIPVLLSVAPALAGALGSLWLFNLSFDLYAQIGMVILIALAGKNAILMNEFSLEKRIEGMTIFESAVEGARLRFRPVMMTSLAFSAGLVPLVISTGPGAGAMVAVGIPVLAGMVVSFTVGIFLIPTLYISFQWMREKTGWTIEEGRAAKGLPSLED
ncbi:efflux RND transporter permease subunit [Pseudovibrio sp. Tun.PSC04-5.I4]|uniref:efflux RND transporter permease subunit n=1 Tax=Pseudovibrio sp. Tun.PSC04-5.I4 TaxID=1798213 RepID=UPI00088BDBFD|nr:efflux RND transporter permease subunit [Pseudovibrio sp. Tun.PSC04-5.I4]SDR21420.1 hydrophobic/amphiphilic exporter-1, HAE1 family [Pseudovibrio sp. Tun.PSC04-5.I4]